LRKIIERLIAILPAILLQILWYYVVYRILKDNNIALNIIKVIGEERYKQYAQIAAPLQQHVNERNAEEQEQKQSAAEYQRTLRIICKDAD